MRTSDIVGYTYRADQFCPGCVVSQLPADVLAPAARDMMTEDVLEHVAGYLGIDRMDERSFDSGDFPKIIFRDSVVTEDDEEAGVYVDTCGQCGRELAEVSA